MNATIVAGVALIIVGVVFLETSQSKGAADTQNDGE
jgi:preprotein translocase subunit SecG